MGMDYRGKTHSSGGLNSKARNYCNEEQFSDLFVNVKSFDFTAVGDGITDDTEAIQKALDYVSSNGGGTVVFPSGIYLYTSIYVTQSNVRLVGSGISSLLVKNSQTGYGLTFGDGVNECFHNSVEQLAFAQNDGVVAISGGALRFNKSNKSYIEHVTVFNFPEPCFRGIYIDQSTAVSISNTDAESCLEDGIRIKNVTDMTMLNVKSDSNIGNGLTIDSVSGLYACNVSAYNNERAFKLLKTDNKKNQFHFYVNCVGDTSKSHNWDVEFLRESTLTNCWGSTQKSVDGDVFGSGFYINGTNCEDIEFNGCKAQFNNSNGFDVVESRRITFFGCTAKKNGQSSGSGMVLGNVDYVTVNGFVAFDDQTTKTQKYGVDILNSADYINIKNCTLVGNKDGGLIDNSITTNKNINDNWI